MKELRLFLLTVGIPAILLMVAGARLIYVEWRFNAHEQEMHIKELRHEPALWEMDENVPPPPKIDGELDAEDDFYLDIDYHEPHIDSPDVHVPPPEPMPLFRLFSVKYGMKGSRDLTILGCLIGLMLLSLVSGSWLLMRAARKARNEMFQQTDFVSNISHEFKTPLTTICLCAELAQDEGIDAAHRKKALTAISDESERLKRLVLNALDFSRLEKSRYHFHLSKINVAEIIRQACAIFASRFADGEIKSPEGDCFATADADAVRQIIMNLLDNAAKYAARSKVEVKLESRDGHVYISVIDHGRGLDSSELKHVFDRFWRGDNSVTRETGGSGLGLAIARGLARGMGGNLTAANNKDGGAIFTLELKA